jgi:uncharacterized protein
VNTRVAALALVAALLPVTGAAAAPPDQLPELTEPINDFAHVIDSASASAMDQMIRRLKAATGDVVVVATVDTVEPYADIREYANKLFENHGKGIGTKGKDNGLLIVLAMKQRQVQIEVGYGLEQWITDGFSGETSRNYMVPQFRAGRYGEGLRAGTARLIGRIAEGRGVTLDGVQPVRDRGAQPEAIPFWVFLLIFIIILIVSRIGGGPGSGFRRRGYWGGGPWSGWSSGVGPFGGGFGGGGGGGFGGGFGGFGGGSSGGGGGGASW